MEIQNRQRDSLTEARKICIAKDRKSETVNSIHTTLSLADKAKILDYVTGTYGMSKIKEVVEDVIQNCEACQRSKIVTTKIKEDSIQISANKPFEKVYMLIYAAHSRKY